jgi:NADP-dependent 3-hydroxy acid dehydrogenase YdfG
MIFNRKSLRRVVVITGASAGVGRAIVREFAKEKAKIGLIARGKDGLLAAKKEVEEAGGEALVLLLDVADANAVEDAARQVEEKFGPIDVWVNDAMVSVFSPVKEMKAEEYRRVTEVSYLGYVHGTLSALKRMQSRDRGIIIQVGSALAYRSIPLQSAYCAAKHAIKGFTESLRTELLHDGSSVRVCVVNLPAVNTPQFSWVKSRLPRQPQPVPPIYQPEVIARAVRFISKHPRKKIDVAMSAIIAVNAEKIAPAFADWYLSKNGYKSQQTDEPVSPDRKDNLWSALPGDAGAHGSFDSKARSFSLSLWLNMYRAPLTIGGGFALAFLAGFLGEKARSTSTLERVFPSKAA